jgi:hypothetical protein
MNYTGNPRHLRSHLRSIQKDYFRRQGLKTSSISERPQLDICQGYQEQSTTLSTGSHQAKSVTPSVSSDDRDTFHAKRRRLLQQKDWLGLDISAPIKVFCPCFLSIIIDNRFTIFVLPRNRNVVLMVHL